MNIWKETKNTKTIFFIRKSSFRAIVTQRKKLQQLADYC